MKLIIQIPCLNEAATLGTALATLPRRVEGFETVEWLVVDDGSTDGTSELARTLGVDHVVRHPVNRGLAAAFMTGIDAALRQGADVIINTDADNQYEAGDIPLLVKPILEHRADMVIGARPIAQTEHFSWIKKRLQHFGSWAVRLASQTDVADAPSGFRALTRETAMRLNVFNAYTYTLETIIQAGLSNLTVVSVPIRTNPDLRPSRLVRSIPNYVKRSLVTILRVFVIYRPMALFLWISTALALVGTAFGVRYAVFLATGHVPHRRRAVVHDGHAGRPDRQQPEAARTNGLPVAAGDAVGCGPRPGPAFRPQSPPRPSSLKPWQATRHKRKPCRRRARQSWPPSS
jgi:glycosyltransferase involved in cell wall biosynthesis